MMWRHKKLLWFGLLSTGLGTAGVFEFLLKAYFELSLQYTPNVSIFVLVLRNIVKFCTAPSLMNKALLGVFMLVGIAVGLLIFYFLVTAQGTLLYAAARYTKERQVDLYEAWGNAKLFFWPLCVVNAIRLVLLLGILVALRYPLLAFTNPERAVMSQLPAFLLIVVCMAAALKIIIIGFYSSLYVVVKERGALKSIRSAVRLLMRHWLVSVEVAVIVLAISLFAMVGMVVSAVVLLVPVVLFFYLFVVASFSAFHLSSVAANVIMNVFVMLFIAAVGGIMAVYTTWVVSAWTSLFLHMHDGALVSRVLHWTKK